MLNTATVYEFEPIEPGIHPIAAKIRDIILAKAADGQPTTEDDLAHFSIAEIKAHFRDGKAAAHAMIVRQVDDDRGFETRHQLLTRATTAVLRMLPDHTSIFSALRRMNLTEAEIVDLWPDLVPAATGAMERLLTKAH